MAKLALSSVLSALDRKDRAFFDNLNEEEQKEIQPYVLIRYMAFCKGGGKDLKEWYFRATNEFVNTGFWDLNSKHKKLMWNMLCDISPNMGKQFHEWVPMAKKTKNKKIAVLEEIFPNLGDMELETLDVIYTKEDVKQMLLDRGWDAKRIKSAI